MPMPEYENLTKDELEFADHYFESGNFNALAKLQKISAERGNKPTGNISVHTILKSHTVKSSAEG